MTKTNGMLNHEALAIKNAIDQTGSDVVTINYNPTHGFLGDGLESGVDKAGLGTTGVAKQTGNNIAQLSYINKGNINMAAHSQGTQQTYLGLQQHKEELAQLLKDNPNATLTLQNSGSPVSSKAVQDLVVNEIYGGQDNINRKFKNNAGISNAFRSQVNPGDPVALPGGNFGGINNNISIFNKEFWQQSKYDIQRGVPTIMKGGLSSNKENPSKTSPHSGYPCVIGCGDNGYTPSDSKFYYNLQTDKDTPLFQYYKTINVDSSKAKFNTGSN